jgi:hypothetical protein
MIIGVRRNYIGDAVVVKPGGRMIREEELE